MKNIHILPTDKPSRLHLAYNKDYYLSVEPFIQVDTKNYKSFNIYITSDEYKQRMDWVIYKDIVTKLEVGDNELFHLGKKIILTTDQDLIKDGVQDIDDEFLEWFVKNTTCNVVQVEKYSINCSCENQAKLGFGDNKIYENSTCHERNRCDIKYKIIIPIEERCSCEIGHPYNNLCCKVHGIIPKEEVKQLNLKTEIDWSGFPKSTQEKVGYVESKQESLERAAKTHAFNFYEKEDRVVGEESFIAGAKWESKNGYSEEEVEKLLISCKDRFGGSDLDDYVSDNEVKEWFERYKKK